MKNVTMMVAVVALAGCSVGGGVFSTKLNVQQIGKDSYTTRATGNSATMAKQAALSAANAFCVEQKRNVQLVKESTGMEDDGSRYHDITFLCVPAGDEDFVRVRRESLAQ